MFRGDNPCMHRRQKAIIVGLLGLLVVVLALGRGDCSDPGTAPPSLIKQARDRQVLESTSTKAGRSRAPARYRKREGLHIDIPYLSGRRVAEISAPDLDEQLGVELSRKDLPQDETHIVFDQAEVWTFNGRIYRIRKELAHPMDIPTALGTSGFPLDLGTPIDATTEVRWNHEWNQRRIRLLKNAADGRLYDVIDVVKFLPKELP